jgi:hypothetical protein
VSTIAAKTKDLDQDYAAAGFDGRLAFGRRPALLVIDVVEAYLQPSSPLYAGMEAALASNVRLIEAARAAGAPLIFTNVAYQAGGVDGGVFYRKVPALKCFEAGSPLSRFPLQIPHGRGGGDQAICVRILRHVAGFDPASYARGHGADRRVLDVGLRSRIDARRVAAWLYSLRRARRLRRS